MSRLGDFLEAVYGPVERFTSLQASIRQWRNLTPGTEFRGPGAKLIGRRKTPSSAPRIDEALLSVWIAPPDRTRIEKRRTGSAGARDSITVVNGEKSWEADHEGHVEVATGKSVRAGLVDAERHFDRIQLREFFTHLNLEERGISHQAGQDCVVIRAVLRPGGHLWPHWLASEADEYEFHADPRRGVLLSILARARSEVFETSEVTQAIFDEPIADDLFTYVPRPGEQIRPPDQVVEHLSLAEAAQRMPFPVLVPTHVPDGGQLKLEVIYHPPGLRRSHSYLSLMYIGDALHSLWIHQAATPNPELDEFEWENAVSNGKSMRISDPGGKSIRIVALVQEGTHVEIWSDLERKQLLDLAASLAPATSSRL